MGARTGGAIKHLPNASDLVTTQVGGTSCLGEQGFARDSNKHNKILALHMTIFTCSSFILPSHYVNYCLVQATWDENL